MSRDSFEKIVGDQFPPNEWRSLELDENFPYLQPVSGVGKAAINLHWDWAETNAEYHIALRKHNQDRDDVFAQQEFEDAKAAALLSEERRHLFAGLYGYIWGSLATLPDHYQQTHYEQVVIEACHNITEEMDAEEYLAPGMKSDLRDFVAQVGVLYRIESDCHFSNLRTKHTV